MNTAIVNGSELCKGTQFDGSSITSSSSDAQQLQHLLLICQVCHGTRHPLW
jgi:hypothetical protein